MEMKKQNNCKTCGKLCPESKGFRPRLYCSKECKADAHNHVRRKFKNPITKKCKTCGIKFETDKFNPNQDYCSKKCGKKFNRKKNYKKYLETERKYNENNREKVRENAKRTYDKNKEKISQRRKELRRANPEVLNKEISRSATREVILLNERLKKKIIEFPISCRKCNSTENLEIHHDIYPKSRKEVREALVNRKIYYLCRDCHGKTWRKKV